MESIFNVGLLSSYALLTPVPSRTFLHVLFMCLFFFRNCMCVCVCIYIYISLRQRRLLEKMCVANGSAVFFICNFCRPASVEELSAVSSPRKIQNKCTFGIRLQGGVMCGCVNICRVKGR